MRRLITLLLFMLLVVGAAACGGDEAAPADSAPESVEPVPTEAEVTTAEEAVEQQEPTAEPTAVPTDPPPTAEPTSEPTAEAAADDAEAAEPDQEVAAAGDGWGESGTTAQSACDHPYFPLREGYTYTMSSEGDEVTWEVVSVTGDLEEATAEMRMTGSETELGFSWTCSADGGLVSYEFGNMSLGAFDPNMRVELTAGEGQFLPPVEAIDVGYSWPTSMTSTVAMTDPDLDLELEGEMVLSQTNTVVGTDAVSWDGQMLPGFTVQQDSDMEMAMSVPGMDEAFETTMQMGGEVQFAYGIGMVRQTSFTDFGDFTSELLEVYVP
jgi:hypothetical protein